ncbi:MAG: InlB B-repeat-containing protein [Firmicutes bacterium]|nr:InlB B-repeat-containing protein [Bacillota bacterium]
MKKTNKIIAVLLALVLSVGVSIMLMGCSTIPVTYYTITFDVDGSADYTPNPMTLREGTVIATIAPPPRQSGRIFQGWYLDADHNKPVELPFTLEGDMTIYARWKPGYKIVFDVDGLTCCTPDPLAAASGTEITELANPPIRVGRIFRGWYFDPPFYLGEPATQTKPVELPFILDRDMTIYARWEFFEMGEVSFDAATDMLYWDEVQDAVKFVFGLYAGYNAYPIFKPAEFIENRTSESLQLDISDLIVLHNLSATGLTITVIAHHKSGVVSGQQGARFLPSLFSAG